MVTKVGLDLLGAFVSAIFLRQQIFGGTPQICKKHTKLNIVIRILRTLFWNFMLAYTCIGFAEKLVAVLTI